MELPLEAKVPGALFDIAMAPRLRVCVHIAIFCAVRQEEEEEGCNLAMCSGHLPPSFDKPPSERGSAAGLWPTLACFLKHNLLRLFRGCLSLGCMTVAFLFSGLRSAEK